MRNRAFVLPVLVTLCFVITSVAQVKQAPPNPPADERFKADILLVVAHPDDETMVTGYFARAVYDEHRRVAVVFTTRGDGGGNAVGNEQAAGLGVVREIEGRRALASLGIMNVWFLNGPDTPGQDVLRSLETWNHGATLGQVIRLVRLTRPEVILTWLPAYVAGENHDDHQAAGVIATEAFDMAGDPTVFPEQISAPRNRWSISNLTEGLHSWQPKKIYYFTDASHLDFIEGQGPKYSTLDTSPSRQVPYFRLAAEEMAHHLTQGDTGQMAKAALAKGDFRYFQEPERLIFGKSLVQSSVTGDIFEGVSPGPIPFAPVRGYQSRTRSGLSLELGGPWAFYRDFWVVHSLDHLAQLLPNPEVAVGGGETLHISILIRNDTDRAVEVTLSATLPPDWKELSGTARYPVLAHDEYPVQAFCVAPSKQASEWQPLTWTAEVNGKAAGSVSVRVQLAGGGLPQ